MSYDKYKTAQNQTEDPRQVEYRIFARITGSLMDVQGQDDFAKLTTAVDMNRRLWLALQTDLAQEDNMLPDQLKAQLISLAIWVDKHSLRVLRGESDIDALIDVNRSIMEGLAPQSSAAAPGTAAGGAAPIAGGSV